MPGADRLLKGLSEKDNRLGCLGIVMYKITAAILHPLAGSRGSGVVTVDGRAWILRLILPLAPYVSSPPTQKK